MVVEVGTVIVGGMRKDGKAGRAIEMTKTVKIERMSYGTDGIAHLESGKTVFVSGASIGVVPGDVSRIEVDSEHKRFDRAHVIELVDASTHRTANPPSAISPWAPIDYDEQLRQKRDAVESALLRTGNVCQQALADALNQIVPSPDEWGYRNKVELMPTSDDRGRMSLGFADVAGVPDVVATNSIAAESSDGSDAADGTDSDLVYAAGIPHAAATPTIVPIEDCPLANDLIDQAPAAISGALRFAISRNPDLEIHRVGIRASTRTNKVEVALWTPPGSFPRSIVAKVIADATHATSVVRVISDGSVARKVKKVEVLSGDGYWRERLAGCSFKVSAPSFFQVNTAQAETLVEQVIKAVADYAGAAGTSTLRIADVYSGVGTFSIPLAKAMPDACISAIELAGSSARDFERNCRSAEVDIDFICDDAARALPQIGQQDIVIVDPPRAGLSRKAMKSLLAAKPHLIAYVSCDPQTLSRDAKELQKAGYALKSATPVDMFPQTYHVETVATFARAASTGAASSHPAVA